MPYDLTVSKVAGLYNTRRLFDTPARFCKTPERPEQSDLRMRISTEKFEMGRPCNRPGGHERLPVTLLRLAVYSPGSQP